MNTWRKSMTVKKHNRMTAYDRLSSVLQNWYSEEQIKEIWAMLKDYDAQLMSQTKITDEKNNKQRGDK